jgi:hypothetical protein
MMIRQEGARLTTVRSADVCRSCNGTEPTTINLGASAGLPSEMSHDTVQHFDREVAGVRRVDSHAFDGTPDESRIDHAGTVSGIAIAACDVFVPTGSSKSATDPCRDRESVRHGGRKRDLDSCGRDARSEDVATSIVMVVGKNQPQ